MRTTPSRGTLCAILKLVHYTTEDIIVFLKKQTGLNRIEPDADLFRDVGIYGDDFHDMIEKYSAQFKVDMSSYLWYFHTNEEGRGIGSAFFKPPYELVKRIPVTPLMLTEFANHSKWNVDYPEHKIPTKRYDLLINQIIVGLILLALIAWLIIK